jgi:hypothetical protein
MMTGRPEQTNVLHLVPSPFSKESACNLFFTCHTTPTNNSNPRAFPVLSDAQPHVHVGCREGSGVLRYRTALCCNFSADRR